MLASSSRLARSDCLHRPRRQPPRQMYYRQTGEELEAAAVSSEAWGNDLNNARLGEQTFSCYVNAAEFAAANRCAAKLQRQYPSVVSYSLWSIVTTVLQVSSWRGICGPEYK